MTRILHNLSQHKEIGSFFERLSYGDPAGRRNSMREKIPSTPLSHQVLGITEKYDRV